MLTSGYCDLWSGDLLNIQKINKLTSTSRPMKRCHFYKEHYKKVKILQNLICLLTLCHNSLFRSWNPACWRRTISCARKGVTWTGMDVHLNTIELDWRLQWFSLMCNTLTQKGLPWNSHGKGFFPGCFPKFLLPSQSVPALRRCSELDHRSQRNT